MYLVILIAALFLAPVWMIAWRVRDIRDWLMAVDESVDESGGGVDE